LIIIPGTLSKLPFNIGMVGVLTAILVFCASFGKGYILPFPSIRTVFTWIGSRSYAIYLTHIPAFLVTREIWYRICMARGIPIPNGTYTLRFSITALALTLLFTEFNYRVIESPLRRKGAMVARGLVNSYSQAAEVVAN
jgi:peptidoglycan/LPS O-acetylase OafA/YrhL